MGLFIAALILSFVFTVNANSDRIITEKCLKDNGITRDEYMGAALHNAKDVDVKIRCTAMCIMKAYNLITKEGSYDVDQTVKDLSRILMITPDESDNREQIARNIIEDCVRDKVNDCDSAYNLMICMNEKLKEFYNKH